LKINDVHTAKAAKQSAEQTFDKTFWEFFRSIDPMPYNEVFWKYINGLTDIFENSVSRFTSLAKPNQTCVAHAAEIATQELGRLSKLNQDGFKLADFVCFVPSYNHLIDQLGEAIDASEIEMELTDDPFGDFCDLLPLAGRTVVENILAKKYRTRGQLVAAIRANVKLWLNKTIMEGECYISMGLNDSLKIYI
jgi:hypothetical protein